MKKFESCGLNYKTFLELHSCFSDFLDIFQGQGMIFFWQFLTFRVYQSFLLLPSLLLILTSHFSSSNVSKCIDFITENLGPRLLWIPLHCIQINSPKFKDTKSGGGSKKINNWIHDIQYEFMHAKTSKILVIFYWCHYISHVGWRDTTIFEFS